MKVRKLKKQLKRSYGKTFIGSYYNGSMSNDIYFKWIDDEFDDFQYVAIGKPNGVQLLDLWFNDKTKGTRIDGWEVSFN